MWKYLGTFAWVITVLLAAPAGHAATCEWPQWRGPDGNGISAESDWNPAAVSNGVPALWQTNVGEGYSSVSIAGGRLFTMANRDDRDIVFCLDAATGAEIWTRSYACPKGSYAGPRSTPAVDGASVYTVSREGDVLALDKNDGQILWKQNIVAAHGAKPPKWGHATSARIAGDLLLLNACVAGLALNKQTGEKVWASDKGVCGYATPVLFGPMDSPRMAIFSALALHVVDVKTGNRRGSYPWRTKYDINAADPIVSGDQVFIGSGYGTGSALLNIGTEPPAAVWQNELLGTQFSSAVLIDGSIYGIDGNVGKGTLRCLDWSTGAERWGRKFGFGSLMAAGDKLIVLSERGDLVIVKVDPAAYHELARAEGLLGKTCWTPPVLCGGIIYCRNDKGNLVAVDVRR